MARSLTSSDPLLHPFALLVQRGRQLADACYHLVPACPGCFLQAGGLSCQIAILFLPYTEYPGIERTAVGPLLSPPQAVQPRDFLDRNAALVAGVRTLNS